MKGENMQTEPLGSELRTSHLRYRDLVFALLALFVFGIAATFLVIRLREPNLVSFMSDRDENFEIFVMEVGSTEVTNITNHEGEDGLPAWSSKKDAIAFLTTRDTTFASIYRMDVKGEELTLLVSDMPIIATSPNWSPNGEWLAFDIGQSGQSDVYVVSYDGEEVRNLTDHPSANRFQDWSPDSEKIMFTSNRDDQTTNYPVIYELSLEGGETTALSDKNVASALASWSPDGSKIAFASDQEGDVEIYLMDRDGKNLIRLTESVGFDGFPEWSPDGSKIAFITFRDENPEIYVMDPDGSNQINLTNDPGQDASGGGFSWSSDGSQILFDTDRDGNFEVYVMEADGSNPTNLTNHPATDLAPTWVD
jgi:Tol biopolymer transport system component